MRELLTILRFAVAMSLPMLRKLIATASIPAGERMDRRSASSPGRSSGDKVIEHVVQGYQVEGPGDLFPKIPTNVSQANVESIGQAPR